jgi:hypothetical protein
MSGHRSGPPEAANPLSWTAECAYLPIRLTCNLRTAEVMPVARILTKECPHVDETRTLPWYILSLKMLTRETVHDHSS